MQHGILKQAFTLKGQLGEDTTVNRDEEDNYAATILKEKRTRTRTHSSTCLDHGILFFF